MTHRCQYGVADCPVTHIAACATAFLNGRHRCLGIWIGRMPSSGSVNQPIVENVT
jgi:hypothetical protein